MATKKTIQMELIKLKTAYPYPDRSVDELKTLAEIWIEDFSGISDESLKGAVKHHRQNSQFFPTTAEILNIIRDSYTRPARLLIESEPPSDAEIEKNLIKIRGLVKTVFKEVRG